MVVFGCLSVCTGMGSCQTAIYNTFANGVFAEFSKKDNKMRCR